MSKSYIFIFRDHAKTLALKDQELAALKTESEQAAHIASAALAKAQEDLLQSPDGCTAEIASLKAEQSYNQYFTDLDRNIAMEAMKTALSEAEAGKKVLADLNASLEARLVQLSNALAAEQAARVKLEADMVTAR